MKVKCALVQMNYSTDVAENVATAAEYVREAGRAGARVICLPELTTT
jgi:predicted amidohydrolase